MLDYTYNLITFINMFIRFNKSLPSCIYAYGITTSWDMERVNITIILLKSGLNKIVKLQKDSWEDFEVGHIRKSTSQWPRPQFQPPSSSSWRSWRSKRGWWTPSCCWTWPCPCSTSTRWPRPRSPWLLQWRRWWTDQLKFKLKFCVKLKFISKFFHIAFDCQLKQLFTIVIEVLQLVVKLNQVGQSTTSV